MGILAKNELWQFIKTIDVTISHKAGDTYTYASVPHNLNFIPVVLGMVSYSSGTVFRPTPVVRINTSGTNVGGCYEMVSLSATATDIIAELFTPDIDSARDGSTFSMNITVYLFRYNAV